MLPILYTKCFHPIPEFHESSEEEQMRRAIKRSRRERGRIVYDSDDFSSEDDEPPNVPPCSIEYPPNPLVGMYFT